MERVRIDVKPWPGEQGDRCAAYRSECRGACGKGDKEKTIPFDVVWKIGASPTQEELEESWVHGAVQYQEVAAVEGKGKDKGKNVDGKGKELFAGVLMNDGNYWPGEDKGTSNGGTRQRQ